MKMLVGLYHDIHLDLNIYWATEEMKKSPYEKSIKAAHPHPHPHRRPPKASSCQ